MAVLDLSRAIQRTLREEMERDETIVLLGEEVSDGGAYRTSDGLREAFGPERVLESPIAEGGAIGTAVGMALYGLRPVVELPAADDLWPGLDQLAEAGRMRYRSGGRYRVPLVVRIASGGGVGAGMDQSASPEGVLVSVPGLTVVSPSDAGDASGLLRSALRSEDPVVVLEPKRLYGAGRAELADEPIELGSARLRREGTDVTLLCWGGSVPVALEAAEQVAEAGIQTEVVDLRTLAPADIGAILRSLSRTGRLVIVEEGPRTGGLGAELAAVVGERAILHLEAPVLRVAGPDVPMGRAFEELLIPDPERVAEALERVANF